MSVNYKQLKLARVAGRTLRVHTMPLIHRQTVGEHTYGVLHILYQIIGPRRNENLLQILFAAMFHDATEAKLGDTPATAKWDHPKLEAALKDAEDQICDEHLLPRLDPRSYEQKLLKFADCMELALFGLEEMRMGNTQVENMVSRILNAIVEKDLQDVTPEAREMFDVAIYEYNDWKRKPK